MARILDTLTGQVADVPDDVAALQVAKSDRYQDVTAGRVQVRTGQGERGDIALDDLPRARQWGYEPLNGAALEEERLQRLYGDAPVRAGAEGLARGASIGLSDQLFVSTGLATPEALRERADRHEVISGATEIAGTVLPALLPGGQYTLAGAAARGTTALGARVATSAAARSAVAGATEGVLYGVGSVLSQRAQERNGLTAEKAAAEIGLSALTGGAAGFAASRLESAAARRLLGRTDDAAAAQRAELGRLTAGDVVDGSIVDEAARPATLAAGRERLAELGDLVSPRAAAAVEDAIVVPPVAADDLAARASAAPTAPTSAEVATEAAEPVLTPKQVRRRILEQWADHIRSGKDWFETARKGRVNPMPASAPRRGGGVYEVPLEELDDVPAKVNRRSKPDPYAEPPENLLAPIKVIQGPTPTRSLADGNHRLAFARMRGDKTIRVWFDNDAAAAVRTNRPRGDNSVMGATAPMDFRPPPAAAVADDVVSPGSAAADDTIPPVADAPAGGGTPPPPGGAPPPPPGPPDDPFDPQRLIDSLATDAEKRAGKLNQVAEEAAAKHAGTIRRTLQAMGIDFPSPEKWVLKGLDLKSPEVKRLTNKGLIESAPRTLLADARFAAASKSRDDVAKLIKTKLDEGIEGINASVRRLDEVAAREDLFDAASLQARVQRELLDRLERGTVDERRAAERVRRDLDALLENAILPKPKVDVPDAPAPRAPTPIAERPRGEDGRWLPDPNRPAPARPGDEGVEFRPLTFEEIEDWKRRLDRSLKHDTQTTNVERDELRILRGILNSDQEERAARAAMRAPEGRALFDEFKDAKRLYAEMEELDKAATARIEQAGISNRFFSLTDNMAGLTGLSAGGGFNPVGLAFGAGFALLNKWGRERLPFILALQLRKLDGSPPTQSAARAFKTWMRETDEAAAKAAVQQAGGDMAKAAAAPKPFGEYTDALRRAAAMGERELWAAHTALSADEQYRATMEQAGLDFSATADARGTRSAEGQRRVDEAAQALDTKLDAAVNDAVSGTRKPVRTMTTDAALKRAEKLTKLAASPEALSEEVGQRLGGLAEDVPGAAEALAEVASRATSFLAAKAPKPPPAPLGLAALQQPWKPPASEVARFSRYVIAVEQPLSVLDDVGAGLVTSEGVEALSAVYPGLLGEMRQRLLEKVAARQQPLGYQQRMTLQRVLGSPLDASDTPAAIAVFQAAYAPKDEQGQPAPRSSEARATKRLESEFSPADRLANRGVA